MPNSPVPPSHVIPGMFGHVEWDSEAEREESINPDESEGLDLDLEGPVE